MKGIRLLLLFLLMFFFATSSVLGVEVVRLPGTGACEVLLLKIAAVYNGQQDKVEVVIPPSVGSSGGIKKVIAGENEFARVARALKKNEYVKGMSYLPFARDPVVFVVGSGVGLSSLSPGQLAAIFSGRFTNWKALGGPDKTIRVLIREQADSSLAVIRETQPLFTELDFTRRARMVYHDSEMVDLVNKFKYSIGWMTLSTNRLTSGHALAMHVLPTDHTYPMQLEYAFVFKKKSIGRAAKSFMEFVLSPAGRTLLQ